MREAVIDFFNQTNVCPLWGVVVAMAIAFYIFWIVAKRRAEQGVIIQTAKEICDTETANAALLAARLNSRKWTTPFLARVGNEEKLRRINEISFATQNGQECAVFEVEGNERLYSN